MLRSVSDISVITSLKIPAYLVFQFNSVILFPQVLCSTVMAIESFWTSHLVALTFFVAEHIANIVDAIFRFWALSLAWVYLGGQPAPTPEDIPERSNGTVFSEIFRSVYALKGVGSLLTDLIYLTGFWTLFYKKDPCFTWVNYWLLTSSTLVSSLNERSSHAISSGSANSSEATAFSSPISDRQLLFSCYERKRKRDKSEVYINNRLPNCLIYKFSVVLNAKITLHFIKLTR